MRMAVVEVREGFTTCGNGVEDYRVSGLCGGLPLLRMYFIAKIYYLMKYLLSE
jgi:hypothetical protein